MTDDSDAMFNAMQKPDFNTRMKTALGVINMVHITIAALKVWRNLPVSNHLDDSFAACEPFLPVFKDEAVGMSSLHLSSKTVTCPKCLKLMESK